MSRPGQSLARGAPASGPAELHCGAALIPALVVLLLSAAVAAAALFSQQWALTQAARAVPGEGLYWSVAQYQIAHQRLKQELRAVAAGEPADPEAIARRWAVLSSRGSILGEPSAIKTLLEGVSGFEQASGRITELHRRIAPLLDRPEPLTQANAQRVLQAFHNADDETLLSQLSNDARQAELAAKESALGSLGRRLIWVWSAFGLCWAVLALWLLQAVRSARRMSQVADERQRAVVAMEQAITAKRSFVSMVSHELRSPLQSIVTAAESLQRDVALGQSRPQSGAAIRRIHHAVSGLQAQLRDLLTIARSDALALGLQEETFDCVALVQDVCVDFEDAAQAKGLTLQVSLPQQRQTVHADPVRIAQVLRNLLQNAVRYTSTGRIEVQLHALDVASTPDACHSLRFTVSDTGPGLPADAVQKLSSSEVAIDPNPEGPLEGMRIGLFVIRDVLRQLGGRIEVCSSSDEGTRACVVIPVAHAAESAEVVADNDGSHALRILVVDDQAEVLAALRDAVQHLGHHCDVANSAGSAEPLLSSTHYDTVLIDLQMPGISGLLLAHAIRAAEGPNARSMLILISAPHNGAVGLQPPFDGFLAKPISAQDLKGLIGSRTRR